MAYFLSGAPRFHAADVALRLYAAGEHFASALVEMFDIPLAALKPHKKGVTSLQAAVGRCVCASKSDDAMATVIDTFRTSADWINTMNYRNAWVHAQAPTMSDLGMVWRRDKSRWRDVDGTMGKVRALTIGGGDPPEMKIDQLLERVSGALRVFVAALEELAVRFTQIIDLVEETHELREENRRLKLKATHREQAAFKKNAYWLEDNGPFCSRCFDSEGILVRLHARSGYHPRCPNCQTVALDPDQAPQKARATDECPLDSSLAFRDYSMVTKRRLSRRRASIPSAQIVAILLACRRRCALCFGLKGRTGERISGQIVSFPVKLTVAG